jgi:hypothetical protein
MTTPGRLPLPDEATALNGSPKSAADSPRNRVADEMRRLSALVVGRPIDGEELDRAAGVLSGLVDQLEQGAIAGKRTRGQPDTTGHPQDFFTTSPVIGYANPISPPVQIWSVMGEGGLPELRGRAFFDYQFEGPPTCVHGGVIAALMDEMLGAVNILTGSAGMTGTLTIKYRAPTPLLSVLDVVARQTGIEGRKIYAWGALYADGVLTAEAEGIFIKMRPERMLEIVTANAEGAEVELIDPRLAEIVNSGGVIMGVEGTLEPDSLGH